MIDVSAFARGSPLMRAQAAVGFALPRCSCDILGVLQWLLQQRGGGEASVRWGRTLNALLHHAVALCRPSCVAAASDVSIRLQACYDIKSSPCMQNSILH